MKQKFPRMKLLFQEKYWLKLFTGRNFYGVAGRGNRLVIIIMKQDRIMVFSLRDELSQKAKTK